MLQVHIVFHLETKYVTDSIILHQSGRYCQSKQYLKKTLPYWSKCMNYGIFVDSKHNDFCIFLTFEVFNKNLNNPPRC